MLDSRIYKESLQLNYKEPINQIPNVHLFYLLCMCVCEHVHVHACVCVTCHGCLPISRNLKFSPM